MARPAHNGPTLADLEALPRNVKGEIIEGVLYTMTRPRSRHQRALTRVGGKLSDGFDAGDGGPGGWWILVEPGSELPNTPEISPDIAGWRKERMPELPRDTAIQVVPDWVCEILSPSTHRHNLLIKKPYYARIGVQYHWTIDLEGRVVIAHRLESNRWVELGVYGDETEARIVPFDAVTLNVSQWWL